MNLLILIHSLHSGGAERVATNLANHWAQKGWQVTVVTMESSVRDFYYIHPAVKRIALNLAYESKNSVAAITNNLRRVVAVRRVLHELRPDVAIGMMSSSAILLLMGAVFVPKIITIAAEHTYPPMLPLTKAWSRLRRWTYPRASKVIMLTSKGLAWLNQEIPSSHGMVIPNPIVFPLPESEPRLSPDELISKQRRVLLAVGRLSEEKQFDLLISIFAKLAPQFQKWDLVVLGDGPLRLLLEAQVFDLGLQGRVHMPGRAGNVGEWYLRSDLYVISSRFEGFPNTLGEAMAHGCAAVGFDCDTGPREIIRHGVDGLLVLNGDVDALKNTLEFLMRDDVTRKRMSRNALEVRERFSIEKISDSWEQLLFSMRAKQ